MRETIGAVALLALSLGAPPLHAQATTTAEGFVRDQEGNPIADAQVLLDYKGHVVQKYRTKTDDEGRFVHVNVYSGPYDITVSKEGLGDVTFEGFVVRDLGATEPPPVFRIGQRKVAPATAAAGEDAAGTAEAPSGEAKASTFAAELERARAALEAGDADAAIATYRTLAEQAPDLPLVHLNLGLALNRKGDKPAAEASFRRAAELDPGLVGANRALSVLLSETGRNAEALEFASRAAAAAPDDAALQYNLGVLYADGGRTEEAREALNRAEQLDPGNAEVQFQLGTVSLAAGDEPGAIAHLERYLTLAAEDAPNAATADAILKALRGE